MSETNKVIDMFFEGVCAVLAFPVAWWFALANAGTTVHLHRPLCCWVMPNHHTDADVTIYVPFARWRI